ncbi:hypothetical protein D1831_07675 [Lactiplantibacillus garii]|uniref:L,D-TPase catalytic domain-containing protein n=1 Tax=Lactiplantibacillus garii TaxID=2306423 RepID=A0A3R8KLE0_9LACO|nr:L,D-transpeptidase family protein [Lactiplantibacillus garii]RRK10429.1 hypothetical protein D1831_07675 [Lactiplantibacillus garii]
MKWEKFMVSLVAGVGLLGGSWSVAQASPTYQRTQTKKITAKTYYSNSRTAKTYRNNGSLKHWQFKANHKLVNYPKTRWTATKKMTVMKKGKPTVYYWVRNSRNNATGWLWRGYLKPVSATENRVTNMKVAKRANQIVTVVQKGRTTATLQLWTQNKQHVWHKKMSAASRIGTNGIGRSQEGSSTTPIGAYPLSFAFGKAGKVKTGGLKYRKIKKTTYWIEDLNDAQYNTWQNRSWANAKNEHLIDYTKAAPHNQYQLAVVMNNRGKANGSGFFIHVKNQWPTAGCVAISLSAMKKLVGQLGKKAYVVNVPTAAQLTRY